ncbi:COG4315 family predicted lipoprotein [Pseudonocardia xinjiangensis]|uniref:COG4315 family predicted lipoprotein n=1 Tax=Pseudonocardia xinjiangensis TaxID=75289 RepID=UPI003D8D9AE2
MIRGSAADRRRSRRWLTGAGVAGLATIALVTTGCSTEDPNSPASLAQAPPHATAMPLDAPDGALVGPQPSALGTILVDGEGRTLYMFSNDPGNVSVCADSCAQDWPFVPAPSPLPAFLPGVTGSLGRTIRPDGGEQLTVDGHPVYTFAGDTAPGQTNGQGKVVDGGLWSVVSPEGRPVRSPEAAAAPANSSIGIPS